MAQYIIGSEIKIALNVEPIGDMTLADYDWEVEFYTDREGVRVKKTKNECVDCGDGSFICVVDTTSLPSGTLTVLITAYIPDADCTDALRTEKAMNKIGDCKLIEA